MSGPSDPIREYILANRDRYTRQAIDQRLTERGYPADDVNAAWAALPPMRAAETGTSPALAIYAYVVYAAGLLLTLAIVIGTLTSGGSPGFALILAIMYGAVGFFVARWIAKRPAPRNFAGGCLAALIVPVVFLFILGGSCLAGLAGYTFR